MIMKQEEKVLRNTVVLELGLDKVDVITSDMIEGYTRIGYSAFVGCSQLTSIDIPNSVTSIGYGAFAGCSHLTSINIPNSVISIEGSAFEDCTSLAFINIPNSVTNIGSCAFAWCSSLTTINIPNSVTVIGESTFWYCSSITSVSIPNSVIYIRQNAFYGCNKLREVVIGDKAFEASEVTNGKCKAYKAFNSDLTCRSFQYEEGKTYEIEDDPKLCKHGFHACLRLTDVFNYYCGAIGKTIVVHEVELESVSEKVNVDDSKVVAKKITIGKRIL